MAKGGRRPGMLEPGVLDRMQNLKRMSLPRRIWARNVCKNWLSGHQNLGIYCFIACSVM